MLLLKEKRRKVSHSRAATFNGKSGDPSSAMYANYGKGNRKMTKAQWRHCVFGGLEHKLYNYGRLSREAA
jgi:hypothetical protein